MARGAAVLVALLLGAIEFYNPTKHLYWDHSGLDVLGQPETLDHAELAVSLATVDLRTGGLPLNIIQAPALPPASGVDALALVQGQPSGAYRLWVRVIDASGNASDWSAPLDVQVDLNRPAAPTRLRSTK